MKIFGERGYDVQRALHLHEQVHQDLKARAIFGDLHLLTEIPVTDLSIFGTEPTLVVAPTQPIHTAKELDKFRKSLHPGVTPDFQTDSVGSYHDINGGLYFGSMSFDNVPGFTSYKGLVITDPHQGELADLEALVRVSIITERPITELVKRTWVLTLPELSFARFLLDYAKGLKDNRYPYSPLFFQLASGLSEPKLKLLQSEPNRLVNWLKEHIEIARNYTGEKTNLALLEVPTR